MSRHSAVLLAAGESRRMLGANKLLLPIEGEPLVLRTLRTLLACGFVEIVVVLGHAAETIDAVIAPLGVTGGISSVFNAAYREGQMSSVNCGVRQLQQPVDGIVVCPADLPLLDARDIAALLQAFDALDHQSILVPTYAGERGNPIVMADPHRRTIAEQPNLGCRHLIDRHPEMVATLPMPDAHCVTDLDTREAYEALLARASNDSGRPRAAGA